jgi:Protein of unknown function (DUF2793)
MPALRLRPILASAPDEAPGPETMDDTPNLKLPYIMAAQAQKHVTHNEAIRALDAVVQIAVADRDPTVPPASPTEGDRYIVAAGATGAWAGNDGKLAAWQDGAWMFYAPLEGWLAWVADEDALLAWDGTAWTGAAGGGASAFTALADTPSSYASAAGKMSVVKTDETGLEFGDQVSQIGVNATPDATNKLAISSEASLFSHAGAGHQHKINKNAASDTASLLFQTGFSGRAEFGTTGDDDWHVKVSPDGSTWHEAIVVDKDTGNVGIGTTTPLGAFDVRADATGTGMYLNTVVGNKGPAFNVLPGTGSGYLYFRPYGEYTIFYGQSANTTMQIQSGSGTGYGRIRFFGNSSNQIITDTNDLTITPAANTIISAGNVGIGTASPAVKLDVNGPIRPKSYTVAGVPTAAAAGQMIYVSDESGGAVLAFSDGTNWRRVTDRAVIS